MGQHSGDQSAISSYLDSLHHLQQLKYPELVELFKAYNAGVVRSTKKGKEKDIVSRSPEAMRIRNRLAECNLRLVVSIAKQFKGHNLPIEDLIQEGNIGLLKAIDRYKWEKGFKFSTYGTWWIRQAITQHVLKRKRTIRLPAHAAKVQREMMRATEEYREAMGCEPTTEELTDLIGASATVVNATMHSGRGTVSLQQPLSSSGEGSTIEDRIEDDQPGCDPFKNVAEKQLLEMAYAVLRTLSPKEAAILRLRFGLVEDATDSQSYPITGDEAAQVMAGKGLT